MSFELNFDYLEDFHNFTADEIQEIKQIVSRITFDVANELLNISFKSIKFSKKEIKKIKTLSATIPFEYVPDKKTVISEILKDRKVDITKDESGDWIVYLLEI